MGQALAREAAAKIKESLNSCMLVSIDQVPLVDVPEQRVMDFQPWAQATVLDES